MIRSVMVILSLYMTRFYDMVLSIHMTRSGCSDSLFCFNSFPNLGSLVVQWTRSLFVVLSYSFDSLAEHGSLNVADSFIIFVTRSY